MLVEQMGGYENVYKKTLPFTSFYFPTRQPVDGKPNVDADQNICRSVHLHAVATGEDLSVKRKEQVVLGSE